MENEKIYYMSIGYPIGLCENDDGDRFFNVENNGEFVGLYNDSYLIWKYCFLDIKEKKDIINHLYKEAKISEFNTSLEISRLKNEGVLIEIKSTKIDDIFPIIKNLYVSKNGFGVGLNKESTSARIINQGQFFDLTLRDFNLWGICNNRITISSILEWYKERYNMNDVSAKNEVINAIFRLKTIDLIRISK